MIGRFFFVLSLIALVSIDLATAAPLGTAFTYQGELINAGHAPTALYDFDFELYDAETGGSLIGSDSASNVQVTRGRFSVEIDFGALIFTGQALWLEIATRAAGAGAYTSLEPRQKLTPVPSSLFSSASDWSGLLNVPPGFADNVDHDTLPSLVCTPNQILRYNGGWSCSNEVGDIESVQPQAGSGLTGGGLSGDVTLGTDLTILQKRITGTCPGGQGIQSVNQDGTVGCTPMQPAPEVVGDTGWFPAPKRTQLAVDLGSSDYDFVFGILQHWDLATGNFVTPLMGAPYRDHMPAYIGLNGSVATVLGYTELANGPGLGDQNNVVRNAGNVRLRAIKRAPDYDTGWESCSSGITYSFSHGLGALPTFSIVEVAENSDGSGWRVPTMSTSNRHGFGWTQATIVEMTTSTVKLRTHGDLVQFRSDVAGTITSTTTGYCRIRLFNWNADFDSGWVSFSNAVGDREKWFQHNLGAVPSLFMLWIAENADGSGWHLPAMFPLFHFGNRGTRIYSVTENWAVVQGGSDDVVDFVDTAGNAPRPNSGYMRFLAWR